MHAEAPLLSVAMRVPDVRRLTRLRPDTGDDGTIVVRVQFVTGTIVMSGGWIEESGPRLEDL
eukprot:10663547-Prorocentrum_lima.AAC.1